MTKPVLNRRHLLAGGATLPLVTFSGTAGRAAAPMQGAGMPRFNRFMLGKFEVTTLLAGTRTVPEPQNIFGMNASAEEFAAASRAAFLPTDKAQFFFTPTVVHTGDQVVLFDTGTDAAGITAALDAAGYAPRDIDVVVITHMHGDHIGGLADGGTLTFPNARYVTGQREANAWRKKQDENFLTKVRPLAEKTTFIKDGDQVVPGITGMAAFGHTPGHMVFMLESRRQQMLIAADTANHYIWSLAYPEWEVKFDQDKTAAAETRKTIFGMLAADRIPFIGYHMPFPGIGFVDRSGGRFEYVPASYQFML